MLVARTMGNSTRVLVRICRIVCECKWSHAKRCAGRRFRCDFGYVGMDGVCVPYAEKAAAEDSGKADKATKNGRKMF